MQKRTAVLFRRRALITEAWILREYFKRQEEAGIGRERDAAAGLGGIQGTTVHPIQQIAAATATCTRFKALCAVVACVTVWWQYRYIFFRVRKNNVEKIKNIINEDEQSFLFTPPPPIFTQHRTSYMQLPMEFACTFTEHSVFQCSKFAHASG